MIDIAAIRAQFPALANARRDDRTLVWLDNAATTQLPLPVLAAVREYEEGGRGNVRRGLHALAARADRGFEAARETIARHLGARPEEIVFTSGTTAGINLLAHALAATMKSGDAIMVTQAEHHSNLLPWRFVAHQHGLNLVTLPVNPDGSLSIELLGEIMPERCRVIAVTHASNVTGLVTDLVPFAEIARAAGAKLIVDGAQAAPHLSLALPQSGIDAYTFSGHKMFGPGGIGVAWIKSDLINVLSPPFRGGGMALSVDSDDAVFLPAPHGFEAGTQPIAQAIGLAVAMDWHQALGTDAALHEQGLMAIAAERLRALPGCRILADGATGPRVPLLTFVLEGCHPHDLAHLLADQGISVRAGHFCAQPLMEVLAPEGATRVSMSVMNDSEDLESFFNALDFARRTLR
jgi:cysteine desulfurase/selenocysteine lyase